MVIPWSRALAWRLERHFLGRFPAASVEAAVEGVVSLQAGTGDVELAVGTRRARADAGAVARALDEGRILKTYLFGGATHLVTPRAAADLLALRGSQRQWELPDWQSFYGLSPEAWKPLRALVRDALADGPLTRDELVAAVTADSAFVHLGEALRSGSQTFLKPFAWQGDLSLGPTRDGAPTFRSLDGVPGWNGIPDLDEAGPRALVTYVGSYGPVTVSNLKYRFGEGLSAGGRRLTGWLSSLEGRLVEIETDAGAALCLAEHVDAIAGTAPSDEVRLLPGYDPWVLGPGTADPRVVPPARRAVASRGSNLVLRGGVVSGSWRAVTGRLEVLWFEQAGPVPGERLAAEAARLGELLDREFALEVTSG